MRKKYSKHLSEPAFDVAGIRIPEKIREAPLMRPGDERKEDAGWQKESCRMNILKLR